MKVEGAIMSAGKDQNEFMGYEEALMSQLFTLDALINVLERKGMITKKEVIEEIKKLHQQVEVSES
jgi:predicted amino acid-binding ACT domain protein